MTFYEVVKYDGVDAMARLENPAAGPALQTARSVV